MSVDVFGERNGTVPTHSSGVSEAAASAAKLTARAEYSRGQGSERNASRTLPIRIVWRSLAPIWTMTTAGFSVVDDFADLARPVEMVFAHEAGGVARLSMIRTFGLSAKTALRPSARLLPMKSPTTSTAFASGAFGAITISGSAFRFTDGFFALTRGRAGLAAGGGSSRRARRGRNRSRSDHGRTFSCAWAGGADTSRTPATAEIATARASGRQSQKRLLRALPAIRSSRGAPPANRIRR